MSLGRIQLVPAAQVDGVILDVRQDPEYEAGHLPGAIHVELGSVPARLDEIGPGPITVMCGHGERATTAVSLLAARHELDQLRVAVGGPAEWATGTGQRLEPGR